jgi:hypothetical protein
VALRTELLSSHSRHRSRSGLHGRRRYQLMGLGAVDGGDVLLACFVNREDRLATSPSSTRRYMPRSLPALRKLTMSSISGRAPTPCVFQNPIGAIIGFFSRVISDCRAGMKTYSPLFRSSSEDSTRRTLGDCMGCVLED